MSTRAKPIMARVGMPALAKELENTNLACRRAGISRRHFYDIKEGFRETRSLRAHAKREVPATDAEPNAAGAGGEDPRDDGAVSWSSEFNGRVFRRNNATGQRLTSEHGTRHRPLLRQLRHPN